MKKIPMPLVLGLAMLVFVCAIAVAEGSLKNPVEIPDALFFGIPFAGLGLALLSAYRSFTLIKARGESWQRMKPYWGAVLLLTMLPMLLLNNRYRGDYDPLAGRVAPDGTSVSSISWSKQGGRYVERLNHRFDIEITEAQYREIMGRHQRALLGVLVVFAGFGFWMAVATLVFERGGLQNGS